MSSDCTRLFKKNSPARRPVSLAAAMENSKSQESRVVIFLLSTFKIKRKNKQINNKRNQIGLP